jgi:glutamyl-tRNA reductase
LGSDAVRHLFRVAASLDSLVLGEPQILGQVKAAFEFAQTQGSVGTSLHRVVGHAMRTAKRVRSETAVGAGQVSVPSVSIDLARQIFGSLEGRETALVGSGQMGEAVAKLLVAAGAKLSVVGRNQERVGALASELGAVATPLTDLPAVLAAADVIVTTTSAKEFVITYDMVAAARRKRKGRSLFMMDLAVPRDIEPRVETLDGVFLYNVDDLSQMVAETLTQRQREASRAETIVSDEVHSYARGLSAEQVTPVVVALRQKFGDIFKAELDRSLRSKLKGLSLEERQAIEKMVDAALNKALHAPTRKLRELASSRDNEDELAETVGLVSSLFELNQSASIAAADLQRPVPSDINLEVPVAGPGDTPLGVPVIDQQKVG